MASVANAIFEAIAGILEDSESLVVGGRSAVIWRVASEERFAQTSFPVVEIGRPRRVSSERRTRVAVRDVYEVTLGLIDTFRPVPGGMESAEERLSELRDLVQGVIDGERWLGLEAYSVLPGFWEWEDRGGVQLDTIGNNLMRMELVLRVPVEV